MNAVPKEQLLASLLSRWGATHCRDFPWRHTNNPFLLLVAELLLRKTQAKRVQGIYEKLSETCATPEQMLNTGHEAVEAIVEDLGLKHRAEWLLRLSRQIVERHGGSVPKNYSELVELQGVGPYAAKMVQCAIFGKAVVPVDNNIARLISRVFGVRRVGDTRREREVEQILEEILRHSEPKALTYAMLDFTAALCTARQPQCTSCELRGICRYWQAVREGRSVEHLPLVRRTSSAEQRR